MNWHSAIIKSVAVLAAGVVLCLASAARAAFVYESPAEFITSADFNGDGLMDVLVLDKLTGNARVGYQNADGTLTWSSPLSTGIENVSGCGVGDFLSVGHSVIGITAATLNRVQLTDIS